MGKIFTAPKPFVKLYAKMREYRIFHSEVFQVLFLSLITEMFVDALTKKSLLKLFVWMGKEPFVFLVNFAIIGITFAVAVMFSRKYAIFTFIAFFWMLLGVINCVVMSNRVTPFNFNDIKVLSSVFSVLGKYINASSIFLMILAVLVLIYLIIMAAKMPKLSAPYFRVIHIIKAVAMGIVFYGYIILAMNIGLIPTNFPELRQAYKDCGFAYCFSNSIFNNGVDKPADYSKESIDKIKEKVNTATKDDAEKDDNKKISDADAPNIIFVQLESFFNVNRIKNSEELFTEDPIPNMTRLYEKYDSGLLSVPSFSAGTVNTEFEVLTGMNMDDFGPGEYPFKTVLTSKTTESIAYNLLPYGYTTHAVHNNTAAFYSRNIVYPNLGIGKFTTVEYMTDVERNALGWAKDEVLIKYINEALDSTSGQDFVFTVSVQGHGQYPDEDMLTNESLLKSVDVLPSNIGEYNFAYYLEQIHEMDAFVGDLIASLRERDEDTVVVLYGDHLPGFALTDADLSSGNVYDTEYAIWSNFDMGERQTRDLEAYELSAYVLDMLGCHEGLINKLHQNKETYGSESDYLEALKMLEYDMLYGDMLCWAEEGQDVGVNPYNAPAIIYGYDTIKIRNIDIIGDSTKYCLVEGDYFTPYSTVYINGTKKNTVYWDSTKLLVPEVDIAPGDSVVVSQSKSSLDKLSHTGEYYIDETDFITGVDE